MTCPKCGCNWSVIVRPRSFAQQDGAEEWLAECTLAGCDWQSRLLRTTDRDEALKLLGRREKQ